MDVIHGIFSNFRKTVFVNNFEELLLKRKYEERRTTRSDLRFSDVFKEYRNGTLCGFSFSLFSVKPFISHEQPLFSSIFCLAQPCNLNYVIYFYDRAWQSSFPYPDFAGGNIGLLLDRKLKYRMKIFYKSTEFHANV